MDPRDIQKLIQSGKAIIIDVREEEELLETGLAEGAIWMPTSKMAEDHPEWQALKASLPKDKKIVLYCRSGARSGRVAEFLSCDGFETENMGGFCEWLAASLPVKKLR